MLPPSVGPGYARPAMRLAISALLLLFASSAAHADTIAGRASIIDADTIEIHGERIRILDIDAPESDQPCMVLEGDVALDTWNCGQKAALALSDWIGNRTVSCETTKLDRYKRHLARCSVGGEDLAVACRERVGLSLSRLQM
jgi:endonuclease YncB( thermonuclease family)